MKEVVRKIETQEIKAIIIVDDEYPKVLKDVNIHQQSYFMKKILIY